MINIYIYAYIYIYIHINVMLVTWIPNDPFLGGLTGKTGTKPSLYGPIFVIFQVYIYIHIHIYLTLNFTRYIDV